MKKLLSLLCLTFALSLCAETNDDILDSVELQILYDNFLTGNNEIVLNAFAEEVIEETKSKLKAEDLVAYFKIMAKDPQISKGFKSIFADLFDEHEDRKSAAELVQTDLYRKYGTSINFAHQLCQLKMMGILQIIVSKIDDLPEITTKKKKNNKIGEIVQLTSANHNSILETNEYVIVNAYNDTSSSCKYMVPIFNELNDKYGQQYCFAKLQVEEQPTIAKSYNIQGLPTVLFIHNEVVVGQELGFMNKDKFSAKIQQHFGK